MLEEWTTSQAIIKSSAGQEPEASDKFRKIILSRAFFAFCLRHDDTAQACAEMIQSADQIDPDDLAKSFSILVSKAFRVVELLSKHAGRQLSPMSSVEQVNFLCSQLREVNRCAGANYLILNRRPTDSETRECDLICSEDGCDSIETSMLSKETIDGLDRHDLAWRCFKHSVA